MLWHAQFLMPKNFLCDCLQTASENWKPRQLSIIAVCYCFFFHARTWTSKLKAVHLSCFNANIWNMLEPLYRWNSFGVRLWLCAWEKMTYPTWPSLQVGWQRHTKSKERLFNAIAFDARGCAKVHEVESTSLCPHKGCWRCLSFRPESSLYNSRCDPPTFRHPARRSFPASCMPWYVNEAKEVA